jgi:hypothetical protein
VSGRENVGRALIVFDWNFYVNVGKASAKPFVFSSAVKKKNHKN